MEITTTIAEVKDALHRCNLCQDVLVVVYPNVPENWFLHTEDNLWELMEYIEENIERNGGYMIDEWQFVDEKQQLKDVRNCVRLKLGQ